jgi:hypothetical protein
MNGINGSLIVLFVIALPIMFVCCRWPSLHLHHLYTIIFLLIWHSNWLPCPLFHSVAEVVAEAREELLLLLLFLISMTLLLLFHLLAPTITTTSLLIWHNSWLLCHLLVEVIITM